MANEEKLTHVVQHCTGRAITISGKRIRRGVELTEREYDLLLRADQEHIKERQEIDPKKGSERNLIVVPIDNVETSATNSSAVALGTGSKSTEKTIAKSSANATTTSTPGSSK